MNKVIDLERFPINRLNDPEGIDLIERCKQELHAHGMFNLDGFLTPQAIDKAIGEVKPVLDRSSFLHQRNHNIYFEKSIPDLDPSHRALTQCLTSHHTICADQIKDSVLIKLYEWPAFADFLATVMEKKQLFTMADPLARLNVMAYRQGQALNWHFDRSEFTTTLLLQSPDQGGVFQYRTGLRTDSDPNYAGVAKLLNNQDKQVKSLRQGAGTLNVFRGRYTAHRVTPVVGRKERIITVFSYYQRPAVVFSDEERIGFYGRAT